MHQATLHGVGVNTKLYFAIFVAFKESMTLNLDPIAKKSSMVIDYGTNRKRIRRLECGKSTIFITPFLFRLKFGVFPLE